MKKNLISLFNLSPDQLKELLTLTESIKQINSAKQLSYLEGKTLLMFFEKPSLRTRISFEVAMTQLGGHAIYYDIATGPLGKKETIEDTARVVSRYCDVISARLLNFSNTAKLAEYASVPVIDALSDKNHPCQIICDLFTIQEKLGKDLKGKTLAYFGDAENNVTYSLMHGTALMGMNMIIYCPKEKEFNPLAEIIEETKKINSLTGGSLKITHDVKEANDKIDVIYTDSWMSYHIPPEEKEKRLGLLEPYQVNDQIMKQANKEAIFMNCLPAQRGMEQTTSVIDGPQSIIFDQAENRLHSAKAIILWLLNIKP